MASFSTLTLGTRKDTDWWRRGMKEKVGYTERVWVKQPEPTMQQMKEVFSGRFFGGHFSGPFSQWLPWPYDTEKRLYNDLDNDPETAPTREVLTRKDNVLLRSKKANGTWEEAHLKKGVEFKQTGANRVILWNVPAPPTTRNGRSNILTCGIGRSLIGPRMRTNNQRRFGEMQRVLFRMEAGLCKNANCPQRATFLTNLCKLRRASWRLQLTRGR